MRERNEDIVIAVLIALALHAVPVLVLVLAMLFAKPGVSTAPGEPVIAEFVDARALPSSMRNALARAPQAPPQTEPPPTPLEAQDAPPEPPPTPLEAQQLQAQERIVDPDETTQDEVRADSDSPETAEREQEARQRQAQIDLTERQRQQEAEQRQRAEEDRRLREVQAELDKIRREREAAARERALTEDRLRQLADRRARQASDVAAENDAAASAARPPPGQRGVDEGLRARYAAALQAAILDKWRRPESVPLGQVCRIKIRQSAGGRVLDAQADPSCPYDQAGKDSVERAVLLAQPLPYAGFEAVFQRELFLDFRADTP